MPASAGAGWSCFGGIGVDSGQPALDDAPWISAWAPGWGSGRLPEGTGVSLPKGSLVVMQVHYNLVNGGAPDRSRAVFTLAPPAGLEGAGDGAAARAGRARLRQGGEGAPLQP